MADNGPNKKDADAIKSIMKQLQEEAKKADRTFQSLASRGSDLAGTMQRLGQDLGKSGDSLKQMASLSEQFFKSADKTQKAQSEITAQIKESYQYELALAQTAEQKLQAEMKYKAEVENANNAADALKAVTESQVKAQSDLVKLQVARNTGLRGEALNAAASYQLMLQQGTLTQEQYDDILQNLTEQQNITQELEDQVRMEEEIAAAILENRDNTEGWGKSLNKAYATSKAIANDPKAMGGLVLGQMISHGKEMVGVFDEMKGEGMAAGQALDATMKSFSLNSMMGLSDTKGALKGLNEQFGTTQGFSAEVIDDIGSIAHEMGISGQEAGNLVGQMMKMNGESAATAQATLEYTKELAVANGLNPGAVAKEMAQNMDKVALFTKGGSKEFAKIATEAKKIGIELSTAAKMSESLLDFESSVEKEMEASVLIGKQLNFDKARQLALQGKGLEAAKEMLKQVGGAAEFNKMNVVQQKALADSMGMSLEELQKQVNAQDAQKEAMGEMTEEERLAAEERAKQLEKIRAIASMTQKYGMFAMSIVQFISQGHLKEAAHWVKQKAQWVAEKAHMLWKKATGQNIAKEATDAAKKGTDAVKGGAAKGADKGKDLAGKAGKDAGKAADAGGKAGAGGGGIGKKLKDLAKGVKAFGDAKVILGGLVGLPATAVGLIAILPGLPGLAIIAAFGTPAGTGLTGLSKGVKKMGDTKVFMGALGLAAVGLGLVPMILGIPALAAIALFGLVAGIGLTGLAKGVKAMGDGKIFMGALGLAAVGIALIPAAFAFTLLTGVDAGALIGFAVALTVLSIAAALLGSIFGLVIMGALAIGVLGLAIIPATIAFQMLAEVPLDNIMQFALALGVLGLAAVAFGVALPLIFLGAIAMMFLGAAMGIFVPMMMLAVEALPAFEALTSFLTTFAEVGMPAAAAMFVTAGAFFVFGGALFFLGIAAWFGTPALIALGGAMFLLGLGVKFASEGLVKISEVLPELADGALGLGAAAGMMALASVGLVGLGLAGLVAFPGLVLASLGVGILSAAMMLFAAAVTLAMPGVELLIQLGSMGEMFAMIAESMWSMAAGIAAFATAGLLTLPTILGLIALSFVAPILTLLGDSINYDLEGPSSVQSAPETNEMQTLIEEVRNLRNAFMTPGVINMDGQKVGDVIGLAVTNTGVQ